MLVREEQRHRILRRGGAQLHGEENLYGNLEITINKNGTFDANITGENLHGKWHKIDGGIEYKNELISGKIFYGPTCIMTFEEFNSSDEGDEDIQVVLVKKE